MALSISPSNKSLVQLEGTIKAITVRGREKQFELLDGSAAGSDTPYFGGAYVRPRFTPQSWVSLVEQSTRLRRCCEVMARNVCGLGAVAILNPDAENQSRGRRNLSNSAGRELEKLQTLLENPNPIFDPISEVFYKVEFDYHASGNGYLEVVEDSREAGAEVMSLLHVPCVNVRVHKSRNSFVRILTHTTKKVYFRRFGDTNPKHRYIDRLTGEFFEEWPDDLPLMRRGTSLIHFKSYCPMDDFYGMPTVVPAVNAVVGNKLAGTWNINFLHNNAHIPLAVVVENGNLSPDSMEQIELFLSREAKGISNAGRIMVLQPDMNRMMQGGNLKINLEPLNIGVSDDASFLKYRDRNDTEIQETFGLSSILLGLGGAQTRATANAAKQVSISNVIHPRTQTWEYILNATIAKRVSGGIAEIKLKRATNLDALQEAAVIQKLMSALTVNDVRAHAAKLLQDDKIVSLDDAIGKMPLASLRNFKPATDDIENLLERLDDATPHRSNIIKIDDAI